MLKAKELRTKNRDELNKMLQEEKSKLNDLNFKMAGAQLKNVSEFSKTKKNIALILTLLKEKNLHQHA